MSLWDVFLSALKAMPGKSIGISVPLGTGYDNPLGNYVHFKDEELAGLDKELCAKLDMARDKAGVPFVITSGKRTPEENAKLSGAVSDSAHLSGLGVDLATGSHHAKNRIIYGLCMAGLADRIGEYFTIDPADSDNLIPHHIHIDVDVSKPQQVTWSRMEKNCLNA